MPATDIFILNVGAGSCAVISHPSGRRTMIDINNGGTLRSYELQALRESSALTFALMEANYKMALTDPIEWYRRVFGTRELWRFILSHPDADHMSGIRKLFDGTLQPAVMWDLAHAKQVGKPGDYLTPEAYQDALAYYRFHYGIEHYGIQRLSPMRFDTAHYWVDDDIEILSPSPAVLGDCNSREDWSNMSYVVRVNYAGRSVMLPGDVEQKGWDDLAVACGIAGVPLRSDVLVASHHGRNSGYPDNGILQAIAPEAVVVSTAKIPAKDDAILRYRRHVANVFSTRQHGSLLIRIWDHGHLEIHSGADTFENLQPLLVSGGRWAA